MNCTGTPPDAPGSYASAPLYRATYNTTLQQGMPDVWLYPVPPPPEAAIEAVIRIVAAHARDADDLSDLLDTLGL